MNWVTWIAVLVAWPLVGLAVAYLFGRFTHRGEFYGNAGELTSPVIAYLRRTRRTKVPVRSTSQPKVRREGIGGRRAH